MAPNSDRTHPFPVLTYGCWGWLWSDEARSKLDATVHRMVRLMFGPRPMEGEPWVEWNTRSLNLARWWVLKKNRASFAQPTISHCVKRWSAWLRHHKSTFFRHQLIRWRSQAHNLIVQGLAAEVDASRTVWKRRPTGRPPRRWQAPMVDAFVIDCFRWIHLDLDSLGQMLAVELPEKTDP